MKIQDVEDGERGGEGVVLVSEARAAPQKTSALIWQLVWFRAMAPAPMVWFVFLLYSVYVSITVTLIKFYYPPRDQTASGNVDILPFAAISLLGSAVFLLIGYRLHASYDRW